MKLLGGQGDRLPLAVVAVVAPLEADAAVFDREEAVVGDRHAVSVAAEVVEHLDETGEGQLGVDDPLGVPQGLQVAGERVS